MAKMFRLSKSQYCKARKCLKAIWLYRHNKELADPVSPFQQNIFDQGTEVGELATQYFENGVLIDEDYTIPQKAIEHTKSEIENDVPAIFEAAFQYKNVLIRVDVLRNNMDGTWDLIEVKSTNSVEPKAHYDDVAVQKWVLENSGIKVRKSFLMHLNRDYTLKGKLEIKRLFVLEELDELIQQNYEDVESFLEVIQGHLNSTTPTDELIGSKCKNPYVCEFKSHCWAEAVPGTIHTIGRIIDKKRHELMDQGIISISEVPNDFKWSTNQQIEVDSFKKNDVHIELGSIKKHLDELRYPLYFLDYESVAYAIPRFEGTWAHKHLITQYSLHIQENPGSDLIHKEYLHDEYSDPSQSIAEKLLQDIKPDGGSIIVYHKTYERDRTKELADHLPEFSEKLGSLIDRMWDLEIPFAKRWYWDPEFNGSSSIKKVLPAFAPEFSYSDLEIQKGDVAQIEYSRMIEMDRNSEGRNHIRDALLKYCERDTLAMVIILEKLVETLDYKLKSVA